MTQKSDRACEWARAYAAETERRRVIAAVTERLKPSPKPTDDRLDAMHYAMSYGFGLRRAKSADFGVITIASTC